MLKALELFGFKSFADKTRFEFPEGITVVVGPNGSGKSNIVDAIKWVLGEQSAKSLRGKEMSDVIFKGSGSGGRKVQNTAEATIIFENADGRLAIDAPEVHVTRRVYRSGEGEYLINRQPCRLRDVKDLFRGTGVGTDAYSLIEQGKVDRLLQASPRDRRAIFEEAAGISRFKAKKIEAQRRLERVDQNLLRLSDIVDEVDSRLRSVRSQASKARRYRELSDRLQQLRTQVGLSDWRRLSERLDQFEARRAELSAEVESLRAHAESDEARHLELETEIVTGGEEIRNAETRLSHHREGIAAHQSRVSHERIRCGELDSETARHRGQLSALTGRAGDVGQRLVQTSEELLVAEARYEQVVAAVGRHQHDVTALAEQLRQHRDQQESSREAHVAGTRRAAELGSQASRCEENLVLLAESSERSRQQAEKLGRDLDALRSELNELAAKEQDLGERLDDLTATVETGQRELEEARRVMARRREELGVQQGRHSGLVERASVLEELERTQHGLGVGTRDLLNRALHKQESQLEGIRGLVADFVKADVAIAALVDVALGAAVQHLVISNAAVMRDLRYGRIKLTGRVGAIDVESIPAGPLVRDPDLALCPGVIGCAADLVTVDAQWQPLANHLLGRTWFVESLAIAESLREQFGSTIRWVTRRGELVEHNGTVIVGPKDSTSGLVSRRSQLESLENQKRILESQIEAGRHELQRLSENIDVRTTAVRRCIDEQNALTTERTETLARIGKLEERSQQVVKHRDTVVSEQHAADARRSRIQEQMGPIATELADVQNELQALEAAIQDSQVKSSQIEVSLNEANRQLTLARVESATREQAVSTLRARKHQFEEDQRERSVAIGEIRQQLDRCRMRKMQAERSILEATGFLAERFLSKEHQARRIAELIDRRAELNRERSVLAETMQRARRAIKRIEDQQHAVELEAGEVRHERASLVDRLREDYGIDIGQLADQIEETAQEREAVEEEIASLRRKIANIGAVNMEALDELDDLEARFESLSGQHRDLTEAKQALERIINKINADSRRLFIETLEAIRENFQALYRKAFGGGKADLVLEEGVDVLDAGVDIIATPPGKPQFNNSLLSGGEKALTAVALLLAIFQFRPSPFCVLDEVDAPFDEANIGRFVDVLRDFLGWTKFVLVTHSKKTMTAATTLYGVTMQESGVSKQVSVRFEDVSDDGHISDEAIRRSQSEDAA